MRGSWSGLGTAASVDGEGVDHRAVSRMLTSQQRRTVDDTTAAGGGRRSGRVPLRQPGY
ncbi:MAG TPA: hypothetical protein VK991_06080 [Halomonas sp.]|nr:hypothetical protein [Halomonas sp.]